MLESLNYSFRNPKNIIWVIYRIKQFRNYKKNHGVLRGPQLDKQRWWARLGILRVKYLHISDVYLENDGSVSNLKNYTVGLPPQGIMWLCVPATQNELETLAADYDLWNGWSEDGRRLRMTWDILPIANNGRAAGGDVRGIEKTA